ncbi:MAG: Piwi domain-containing protein [Candidatus Acidiferrales bacterium]
MALPDNKGLKDLRAQHPDWFTYWRDGFLYAVPKTASPRTIIGEPVTLNCSEHLQFIAALIDGLLPKKFPGYEAFRRHPFAFAGKKDELVGAAAAKLRTKPPLVKDFAIRPTFILEAKIVETVPDQTAVGLFLTINTRWETSADLCALQAAGVNLTGLYVVRRKPQPGERRLVGQVGSLAGKTVNLTAAYDNRTTISADEVYLEGSKTSFARCLKALLGNEYDFFEQTRQREEAKLLSGPAVNEMVGQFHQFFRKDPSLPVTEDLTATIGEQLKLTNSPAYQSVHQAPPVQYYFDPARTKASPYPWVGIKQYGPFSKDTFPKRTPTILVVLPDTAQGATEKFLNSFRNGVVTSNPQYEGGFAKLFGLLNPTFTLCKVPLVSETNPAGAYQRAIEESLAANANIDAAIVVLTDQHAGLPDNSSPYLTAKATLMLAGIPAQEIKVSRFAKQPYELQYLLANFAVALYAKMNGTPWTVNQDTTISDELIIGIGTSEVRTNRFSDRARYVGITTVFRGDGNYLLSHVGKECAYEEYPKVLQESTERLLQEIKQRNGWNPGDNVRLIFHTYKPLKNIEIAEIAKRAALAVGNEQTIEFAFLTVTIDHPFLLIDPQQPGIKNRYDNKAPAKGVLVPERGTITQLGRYTRLVSTNGPFLIKHDNAPLPSPLLVHIHKGSTFNDLAYLSEQVLKFTGLSWRSTLPAKKPVSIYYSELIADLLGRLRGVPGWSPAVLNTRLRASRWFL